MSTNFSNQHPPEGPVVSIENVGLKLRPAYDAGMDGVSLCAGKGELILVRLEEGVTEHPLADIVSGLIAPDEGSVRVFGEVWSSWSPDQQAKARWRIGRVFAGHGWLSNLDVDENVTLAERHHTMRPESEIAAEAAKLAEMAGLSALPEGRPAVTDRNELRRAEWVRAAMGSPWLAVFELPGRELSAGWRDDLKPLVRHLRGRGTAVIWICENDDEWNDKDLNPSLKLYGEGNKLITKVAPTNEE